MHRAILSGLLLTALLFAAFVQPTLAGMTAKPKIRAGIPPFSIMELIMGDGLRRPIADRPVEPMVTWLAPADPRIHDTDILASPAGRLYTVRTLDGTFSPSAVSVDYGVLHLLTPVLLITAQTDNQALPPRMNTPVLPPEALEQQLDSQVLQAVERYKERVNTQRLIVVGGVFDLADHYNRGTGRLIIINVNGETDGDTLQKLPIMRRLDKNTRDYIGRRGTTVNAPVKKKNGAAGHK